ncbi:MAG: hypothetical protein KAI72_03265 [Candidatus Pacebacteria bacterium]|nr:hypothetical protein [Candidatus Paceibacterota bacterium]
MKICLINNLYKPYARGGAEQIVKNIADGLSKKNHLVFIIATKPYFGDRQTEASQPWAEISDVSSQRLVRLGRKSVSCRSNCICQSGYMYELRSSDFYK